MAIISECFDDIGARVNKFAMELVDLFWVFENDLRHKGAGLNITATFEFEEITLGADDRAVFKSLE